MLILAVHSAQLYYLATVACAKGTIQTFFDRLFRPALYTNMD